MIALRYIPVLVAALFYTTSTAAAPFPNANKDAEPSLKNVAPKLSKDIHQSAQAYSVAMTSDLRQANAADPIVPKYLEDYNRILQQTIYLEITSDEASSAERKLYK